MKLRPIVLAAAGLIALAGAQAQDSKSAGSQDPLEMQRARAAWLAAKANKTYYAPQFDLGALPHYQPAAPLKGTIRQWGSNYLADSNLAKYLEEGFRKFHPEVKFEDQLKSTFIGMASLYMDRADVAAMGRKATWEETQAFQRVLESQPVEIAMATGSLDIPGWTWALTPVLHKDNPLSKLTLEQLDGIFGAARDGGWMGNTWDASQARGPEKNLRTWGQLGLTGEWADKPIHVYAYNLNYHFPRDFAEKVMGGGYKWNENLREFSNAAAPDGKNLISAGDLLIKALSDDKYGISYTSIKYLNDKTKTVPLARTAQGPFLMPTLQTVQARTYPLTREVYFYTFQRPGQQMNPLVKEYLRFVLSREGQEAVQRDAKYLPMTAEFAAEQRAKLDAGGKAAKAEGG
ncbi:PstS family phosphate ABC transporter substrate-binding protein [Pelomonas sp. KK5]|uniref:PstS family phosphate ABC transporter substrate-binding protein n=1 Tax=Pelomonas sp. KK5 TaxID=1855730 RepID=UPI00097C31C6|nr:substrate-binding domain-containing protein [Pelomonas sp. KK5]